MQILRNLAINIKFANFGLKLHFCTFLGVHTKRDPPFSLVPTPNDPLVSINLTPNAPYFRSQVGTCTSLSYSSAPTRVGGAAVLQEPDILT